MTESNVQPFEFRGNPVATVTTGNGTVLFCAKHVATALGYKRPADAVKQHCKGSVIRRPLETAGGIQQMVFITEGDVYRLIASSKLTSAVEFEHWLFDELVPQIRRTGGYIPQGETPEETMARAVLIASPIAKKLAYESAKDMLRNLDSDEKGKHIVPTLGGEQEMSVITLPGLIHALNNRRPGAVKDEATRNMVIRFQRWVNHELVPTVMRTGRYEVQRPQHLLEAAHHERMMQVELLKASQGIVHPDFLEAKTRIVIARELGELPELDPKTRPLYTQDYLREKNLSAKQLRSKSGTFGKKLKAAYRERNGRDPQRADLTLPNGHIIQVYAYTEEDRPLFDRAWDELSQKAGA